MTMLGRDFRARLDAARADERRKVIAELTDEGIIDMAAQAAFRDRNPKHSWLDEPEHVRATWQGNIEAALERAASLLAPEEEGDERNDKVDSGSSGENKPGITPASPSSEPGYRTPYQRAVEATRVALDASSEPARAGEEWRLVGIDHDSDGLDEISPVFSSRAELDEWRDGHEPHGFDPPYDARVVQRREVVRPGRWQDVPDDEEGSTHG